MKQDSSIARVKETFEDWALYEAVIRNNYMRHNELVIGLNAIAREIPGGLRIVDLGCGDAWLASNAFRDCRIEQYLGVDLSESAAARARINVGPWGPSATVACGDLANFVAELPDAAANLILASNSLHHFGSQQKSALLRHCFRALTSGGVFCWIDPVRNEDESRDGYMRRLTTIMLQDWTGLTEDQRRRATQHCWESDYPEAESWMRDQTARAGFQSGGRFLPDDLFGAWKFLRT